LVLPANRETPAIGKSGKSFLVGAPPVSKRSLPWLQFYTADWESDSIAGCTLAAQGLWLRLICVMHTSRSYGCLESDGKPIPDELLFRRLGCVSIEEYRGLLAELFSAGVPSRRPDGVIYSRRMVRDQQARDATAARVRRHRERSNGLVTPMSQGEVRSQRSEVRDRTESKRAAKPARPADPRSKAFVDFASRSYQRKHGQAPNWTGKDSQNLTALLRQNQTLTPSELERRWNHYTASTEPFTEKQGDSLAYFCTKFDSFIDGPILAAPLSYVEAHVGGGPEVPETDCCEECGRTRTFHRMLPANQQRHAPGWRPHSFVSRQQENEVVQ
jgi:hypothetical protein